MRISDVLTMNDVEQRKLTEILSWEEWIQFGTLLKKLNSGLMDIQLIPITKNRFRRVYEPILKPLDKLRDKLDDLPWETLFPNRSSTVPLFYGAYIQYG